MREKKLKNRRGDAATRRRGDKSRTCAATPLFSPRPRVSASPRLFFPASPRLFLICVIASVLLLSCTRERREFRQAPPGARTETLSQSDLHPGGYIPAVQTKNPAEENAPALSEGKRLYEWYNCSGCHSHGGGGIGP